MRRTVGVSAAAALVMALTAAGLALYLAGGGRIPLAGGYSTGPVNLGEELHFVTAIAPRKGNVELRSAVVNVGDGVDADIRLVRIARGASAGGTFHGPSPPEYTEVPLRGHVLRPGDRSRYALDVTLVPNRTGRHEVESIEVTYEAGRFRTRTATLSAPVCVVGVQDRLDDGETTCPH